MFTGNLSSAHIPFGFGVEILKYDSTGGIIALNKPAGILSHPNNTANKGTMNKVSIISAPYDHKLEAYIIPVNDADSHDKEKIITHHYLWLLNRLDSATSGVILLSDNKISAESIKSLFALREVKKEYLAKVFGKFNCSSSARGVPWKHSIHIDNTSQLRSRTLLSRDKNLSSHNKIAMTVVKPYVMNSNDEAILKQHQQLTNQNPMITSLISLFPSTGYTHQLRFQCSKEHIPIIGDKVYGDFDLNKIFSKRINSDTKSKNRLFLHSKNISFQYNIAGIENTFEASAPIPACFFMP